MHIEQDDLEAYVFGRLAPDRISTVESHLIECSECAGKLIEVVTRTGTSLKLSGGQFGKYQGEERRREPREPAAGTAQMQLLSPFAPARFEVQILDRSANGLKVRSAQYILRGTLVQLRLETVLILGEVRYCMANNGEFIAGIQVQDTLSTNR